MIKQIKGFTLAEVLLTLSIIGIVAAVTIPALLNTVNDAQNLENFKKIYSEISQAIKLISIDNGYYINTNNGNAFLNELSRKITFINRGTWGSVSTLPDGFYYKCYKEPNSTNQCGSWRLKPGWQTNNTLGVLPSGAFIIIRNADPTCTTATARIRLSAAEPNPPILCSEIEIDVNGDKAPNMLGKDHFLIVLVKINGEYRIYPSGFGAMFCLSGYPNNYNYSLGCAASVLKGGTMP